jgi:hypothetical protein
MARLSDEERRTYEPGHFAHPCEARLWEAYQALESDLAEEKKVSKLCADKARVWQEGCEKAEVRVEDLVASAAEVQSQVAALYYAVRACEIEWNDSPDMRACENELIGVADDLTASAQTFAAQQQEIGRKVGLEEARAICNEVWDQFHAAGRTAPSMERVTAAIRRRIKQPTQGGKDG